MDNLRVLVMLILVLMAFPPVTLGAFSGPQDTAVLQGDSATLYCSDPDFGGPPGLTVWNEGITTFASQAGLIPGVGGGKYTNFNVDAGSATPATQLNLLITNAEVSDEGTYTCQISPNQGSATLQVEIEVSSVTITVNGETNPPFTVREGDQATLVCTAIGARPQVSIDWTNDDAPITDDTEEVSGTGDTRDTTSTLLFTPSATDDGHRLMCQTSGQQVATPQSQSITLNVHFKPVVTVVYSDEMITCSADANPLASTYEIILNGTQSLKKFNTSGQSVEYVPDACTSISCIATNTIGTGTGTIKEPICPDDKTTTEMPTTGHKDATTESPAAPTKPTGQPDVGLGAGAIVGILVAVIVIILAVVLGVLFCYKKEIACFASTKSSGGGSTLPKKQPSVANADMIRNQPEVRQSVHDYNSEPKQPRVPRSNTGKQQAPPPEKNEALKQTVPPRDPVNDRKDYYDGNEEGRGKGGLNYAEVEFQDRAGETNGHGNIHYPEEEPTQYASILV